MTAYNAEKTICRALDSLGRNAEPFDLLIVDDCSRLPLAEFLGPAGDGVEIIRPDKNLGVAGAKNLGLARLLAKPYEFTPTTSAIPSGSPSRWPSLRSIPTSRWSARGHDFSTKIPARSCITSGRHANLGKSAMRCSSTAALCIRPG
jgi:hypothetical protein